MMEFRVFASWQTGRVRFLSCAESPHVFVQVGCVSPLTGATRWHRVGGTTRYELERAAAHGLMLRVRNRARCAFTHEPHVVDLPAKRCAELLVTLDVWVEAGCPKVKSKKKPRA